jgi:hypothetical protein
MNDLERRMLQQQTEFERLTRKRMKILNKRCLLAAAVWAVACVVYVWLLSQ